MSYRTTHSRPYHTTPHLYESLTATQGVKQSESCVVAVNTRKVENEDKDEDEDEIVLVPMNKELLLAMTFLH
jgi:hypothetical protein